MNVAIKYMPDAKVLNVARSKRAKIFKRFEEHRSFLVESRTVHWP